jgi:uncharacterized membrane protein YsdA (DUF1294 family)
VWRDGRSAIIPHQKTAPGSRPRRPYPRRRHPLRTFALLAAALAVVAAATLWWLVGWHAPVPVWLVSVNAVTLLAFGYDKAIAGRGPTRVPEAALLGLAALGGSPAALAAMACFRHKTAKPLFRRGIWIAIALQVAATATLAAMRWDLLARIL